MLHELSRLIRSGRNVFVTGRAGTGKTYLLRQVVDLMRREGKSIAMAAPTGMAAVNCEGQTLHGLFHFPVRMSDLEPTVIKKRDEWFTKVAQYNPSWPLDILFIDEISMVRADLFEALQRLLRLYGPKTGTPFGGVQVVIFGDLLQLPPIVKELDRPWFNTPTRWNSEWFFSAKAYQAGQGFELFHLKHNYRQSESSFAAVLDRIRLGNAAPDDLQFLDSLFRPEPEDGRAIHLFCKRAPADLLNETRLAQIHGTPSVFRAAAHKWRGDIPVKEEIKLKVGARVMLKANLDVGSGWVNGTLATVKCILNPSEQVLIARDDGSERLIERFTWNHELPKKKGENYQRLASYTQIPLSLAWGFTIHMMQGQTLDCPVVLHPEDPFDFGQLYVGLSRVRNHHQLSLTGRPPALWLRPNRKAYDFLRYKNALH